MMFVEIELNGCTVRLYPAAPGMGARCGMVVDGTWLGWLTATEIAVRIRRIMQPKAKVRWWQQPWFQREAAVPTYTTAPTTGDTVWAEVRIR
jgi:hypothetical protein